MPAPPPVVTRAHVPGAGPVACVTVSIAFSHWARRSVVDGSDRPPTAFEDDQSGNAVVGEHLEAGATAMGCRVPPSLVDRPRTRPRHHPAPVPTREQTPRFAA